MISKLLKKIIEKVNAREENNTVVKFVSTNISDYNTLLKQSNSSFFRNYYAFEVFKNFRLFPEKNKLFLCDYLGRKYKDNINYIRFKAALLSELGNFEEALLLLNKVEKNKEDILYSIELLMRPCGKEKMLSSYLEERKQVFKNDLLFNMHLATNYFTLSETKKANKILENVKDEVLSSEPFQKNKASIIDQRLDLANAIKNKTTHRNTNLDTLLYDENIVIEDHWEPYYSWMLTHSENLGFSWLSRFYENKIRECLNGNNDIVSVVDFGVMCGLHLFKLSHDFPHVNFYGVDRQKSIVLANTNAFPAKNLHFINTEIENFLADFSVPKDKEALLFHGRTATLCYPEKIKNIYKQCIENNIRNILLFENMSLSHDLFCFVDFNDFPAESIVYKDGQFIHNYEGFLRNAGFKIVNSQRLHSPLVSCDSLVVSGSTHVFISAASI